MKIASLHPSMYLKAVDLEEDMDVTIKGLKMEAMKDNDGNEEEKPVLYFRELDKALVLNSTNKKRILAQHPAEDTDEWNGKRITLTKEWVEAFGKADWAIRVKMLPPQGKKAPAARETQIVTAENVGEPPF